MRKEAMPIIEHWDDIRYTLRITDIKSHSVEFDLLAFDGDEASRCYRTVDEIPNNEDMSKGIRTLTGFAKWDGCTEFKWLPDHPEFWYGEHHCGQDDIERLAAALARLLPAVLRHLPTADVLCAGIHA